MKKIIFSVFAVLLLVGGGFGVALKVNKEKQEENPSTQTERISETVVSERSDTIAFEDVSLPEEKITTTEQQDIAVPQTQVQSQKEQSSSAQTKAPVQTASAVDNKSIFKRYWKFINDGELEAVYAQEPAFEGDEGLLPFEPDPWGVGFATYDLDRDGMDELLICDGSYLGQEATEWYHVMVFRYRPSDDSVRLCGCLYGFGNLNYSKSHGMLINSPYRPSYTADWNDFYQLEGETLQKKFSVSCDHLGWGTDEDGGPLWMYYTPESNEQAIPVSADDYFSDLDTIYFLNELPEETAKEWGYSFGE